MTTKYLVEDLNPTGYLQVMDEVSGGAVQVRYTFGNMLVSQTRTPSTSPATSFYGYDAHGNIAFLTDATGNETDTYTYDAWGNLVGRTGSTSNTRLFAGEEFDPDLGLINLRARQYDPQRGRFRMSDLVDGDLKKPLTLNRYLYANSDPVSLVDPSGMEGEEYGLGLAPAAALAGGATITVGAVGAGSAIGAGTVTLVSTVVGVAGIVAACELIKGSGLSKDEVTLVALQTGNPFLAALAVCGRTITCTEMIGPAPMGACVFKCPDGTVAHCPCTFTECVKEE